MPIYIGLQAVPSPRLVIASDQPGAPRLVSGVPTFTRARVHCCQLYSDVDAASVVHSDGSSAVTLSWLGHSPSIEAPLHHQGEVIRYTSLCFGVQRATPVKDVALYSRGVLLSSTCRDSCSFLRSPSIVGHSKIA